MVTGTDGNFKCWLSSRSCFLPILSPAPVQRRHPHDTGVSMRSRTASRWGILDVVSAGLFAARRALRGPFRDVSDHERDALLSGRRPRAFLRDRRGNRREQGIELPDQVVAEIAAQAGFSPPPF